MTAATVATTRRLGDSDISVRPLCFGGNVFGWTIDEATSFQILDAFVEAGFSFIDTADVYSKWKLGNQGGESEVILGKWMAARGNRERVVLATKVGMELAPDKKGLAAEYILRAAEDSLRRLQTDYIDLYQSHKDDPATPLEETLGAYDKLIKAGKVRIIGASNYSGERLEEAVKVAGARGLPRYQMLQPEYNLYTRSEFEATLQPVCAARGIGVIPYFSLASGFLTGKYRNPADLQKSARGKSVAKYLNPRGFRIVEALERVAQQQRATPTQVALAWLMAQPTIVAPIASATSLEQLRDLIAAATLRLEAASLADLSAASAP